MRPVPPFPIMALKHLLKVGLQPFSRISIVCEKAVAARIPTVVLVIAGMCLCAAKGNAQSESFTITSQPPSSSGPPDSSRHDDGSNDDGSKDDGSHDHGDVVHVAIGSVPRSNPALVREAEPILIPMIDEATDADIRHFLEQGSPVLRATMLQPTPFQVPRVTLTPEPEVATDTSLTARLFSTPGVSRSLLRQDQQAVASYRVDRVDGAESTPLSSTDLGSLLNKSPAALSTSVQRRTPIVNDPRIRGSRIGSLAASGSHWVPARADLDTAVSKIDSRSVRDVVIIPGPYSSLYGPGFGFVEFSLLESPRSNSERLWQGRSSVDFNSNGNQWLGQQGFAGSGTDWGVRFNYAHRTGDDYRAGNGSRVPSGYESREFTLAIGRDLSDGSSIEFSALRLDQTDVEFPGYVFDIDVLVSDGYSGTFIDNNPWISDQAETEVWYNRTWFNGSALNAAKRAEFPLLDQISYSGTTDVDSMSTGYRRGLSWGEGSNYRFTLGHDLRFIKQELNEISSGLPLAGFFPIIDANSPIPRSFSVNPGIFTEYTESIGCDWTFRAGGRVDYVQTDIVDDPEKLQSLSFSNNPATLDEILGTDQYQTDRFLWGLYTSIDRRYSDQLIGSVSLGYAERPPNLTESYAAEPFLLLLQNGLNTVTGDPRLRNEKLVQFDLTLDYDSSAFRAGIRGFHGWALDYITFENMSTLRFGPNNEVQQVNLKYVNTDLATLTGFDAYLECLPQSRLTPFVLTRYVDGRDRTRNGDFATRQGEAGSPSIRVPGLPRGAFSFVPGADSEALPGIAPFEARIGVRLHDVARDPRWNIELAARVVDNQDRIATSLFESATSGFTVWDLRSVYMPAQIDGMTLVAGIENFTDKTYREHLDFRSFTGVSLLQPGINSYVGLDWNY